MFKIDEHRFVINDLRPFTHHHQRTKVVLSQRPFTNHTPYRYALSPLKTPPVVKQYEIKSNKIQLSPLDRLKELQKQKRNKIT